MELLQPEFENNDSRRKLLQLLTNDIKQINVYEAQKDAVLGNHYHKDTTEYFYILKGSVSYNDKEVVNPGMLFKVSPPENHMIRCLTNVKMMTFLTKAYTKEDQDIWKKS